MTAGARLRGTGVRESVSSYITHGTQRVYARRVRLCTVNSREQVLPRGRTGDDERAYPLPKAQKEDRNRNRNTKESRIGKSNRGNRRTRRGKNRRKRGIGGEDGQGEKENGGLEEFAWKGKRDA